MSNGFEALESRCLLTSYVVDTFSDIVANDGVLSLREAINLANNNAEYYQFVDDDGTILYEELLAPDIITFAPRTSATTIVLDSPVSIRGDMNIVGPTGYPLTIRGANGVFDLNDASTVRDGGVVRLHEVAIGNVELRSGSSANLLTNAADLSLDNITVTASLGAVDNRGIMEITNSRFVANSGSAVISNSKELSIDGSTFADNNVVQVIVNQDAYQSSVSINNSTINGNTTQNGSVNNLQSDLGYWSISITNSTISNNTSTQSGAGINNTGTALIVNSTISGNTAVNKGGGIRSSGFTYLAHSTVAYNSAAIGGGIDSSSFFILANSIVSNSLSGGDVSGNITSFDGTNIVADASKVGSNILNVDPELRPLGANGGPTKTHAPQPWSAAVNVGSTGPISVYGEPLLFDQRGQARVSGPSLDLGAFELTYPINPNPVHIFRWSDATEGGSHGRFYVGRSLYDGAMPIHLTIDSASTAVYGEDYRLEVDGVPVSLTDSSFWVRFADQSPNLFIDVIPLSDTLSEAMEDVRLNILPTAYYTSTTPGGAVVSLEDDDTWVSNANDSGDGSLRQALANANRFAGHDTIEFDPTLEGESIKLTSGELLISDTVSINGPGADRLVVSGENLSRVFNIDDGQTTQINVDIEGLTIRGGANGSGGGILNHEYLTLSRSEITANSSGSGGGIFNYGTLQLSNSTISDNDATLGGGILNVGFVTLSNSTISGNDASWLGGGIWSQGSTSDSVSGNLLVRNSTIAHNTATTAGGGVYIYNQAAAWLANNIIANNAPSDFTHSDVTLTLSGVNLVTDESVIGAGVIHDDPVLGPLGNHGGPTRTHALPVDSPAIDAGDNAQVIASYDQRGMPHQRISNGHVDLGAFELQRAHFVVDTSVDESDGDFNPGDLSLREAIELANGIPNLEARMISFDELQFANSQSIDLQLGEIEITEGLTINGPGANRLTINANDVSRIFNVHTAGDTVELRGLRLANGNAGNQQGGAIFASSPLEIRDSVIAHSYAGSGGGIYGTSRLLLDRSTISDSTAGGLGGGIYSTGELTVSHSTISANESGNGGGGILSTDQATISSSTISGNLAGNRGGGIFSIGTLSVQDSTITGNDGGLNSTTANGDGIHVAGGTITMGNTIVAGNSSAPLDLVLDNTRAHSLGHNLIGTLDQVNAPSSYEVSSSVATWNQAHDLAANRGGYLASIDSAAENNLLQSLGGPFWTGGFQDGNGDWTWDSGEIWGYTNWDSKEPSTSANGGLLFLSNGTWDARLRGQSFRYLIEYPDPFTEITDMIGVADPRLGPLADNGGSTKTHALLPGSPAIDQGSSPRTNDQRGVPFVRTAAGAADIGAFERQSLALTVDDSSDVSDGNFSSGHLSLREAIGLANANPGPDMIQFAESIDQTLTLSQGRFAINDNLVIHGLGADRLVIDAAHGSQHFYVAPGISLSLSDLTLENGSTCIHDVCIDSGTPSDRTRGGSIYASQADVTIVNAVVRDNWSWSDGGAIYANLSSTLTIVNSTIANNSAGTDGGGIYNHGILDVVQSTIVDNQAATGAGIVHFDGLLTLTQSTVVRNTARGFGGGLAASDYARTEINNSIVAGNWVGSRPSDIEVLNNISSIPDQISTQNSHHNLIGDPASAGGLLDGVNGNLVGQSGAVVAVEQILETTVSNSGLLQVTLIPGSLAIDRGDASLLPYDEFDLDSDGNLTEPLPWDQYGHPRQQSYALDIGAFEMDPDVAAPNGGDGNFDGIPDSQQDHVESIPTIETQEYITLESAPGTTLAVIAASPPAADQLPIDAQLSFGVVDFSVQNLSEGQATTVTLTFDSTTRIDAYLKFGPTPDDPTPHWYDFQYDDATGTGAIIAGNVITLHFVDGLRGDNDLTANGVIQDPGGPVTWNAPPEVLPQSFSTAEGTTFAGSVVASDADLPDEHLTFSLTGNGADDAKFSITADGELEFVAPPDFESPDDSGGTAGDNVYLVEVQVEDTKGRTASAIVAVNVLDVNESPSLTVDSPIVTVNEGEIAANSGAFDDLDLSDIVELRALDPFGLPIGSIAGGSSRSGHWEWSFDAVDGPLSTTVTMIAEDIAGATAEKTFILNVDNVAPHSVTISGTIGEYVLAVGTPVPFRGTFADAGVLDEHTAEWKFSHVSGTETIQETRTGTVQQGTGGGTVEDRFSFDAPGVYRVTLAVSDGLAETTSAETMFVVYDPSEGFVTGGGWIDSPAGAYVDDPTLTGKANFGFVAKYKKGASVPTGQTEFQFRAADLDFHSTEYQWLVVSGGRAQFKGTGTINGVGTYGFILTAVDGEAAGGNGVDRFRLKIWDVESGQIVYDTGLGASDDADPNTALGGGQIRIQR